MKTRILLTSVIASLFTVHTVAQTDITPDRYVFANQPEGEYTIDYFNGGANPPSPLNAVLENWNDGFVMVAGAPPIYGEGADAEGPRTLQSGLNIVDLGGEVGKVLCFKGADCKYEKGVAMDDEFTDLRWYNLNFYTEQSKTPYLAQYTQQGMTEEEAIEKAKIRVRLVFSFTQNILDQVNTVMNFYSSTFRNDVVPVNDNGKHSNFRSGDFCEVYEDDGEPKEDENGNLIYDPTRWMIYEYDTWAASEEGVPTRIKIEIENDILRTGTLFIKELKFSTDVTGDPIQREYIKLIPENTNAIIPVSKDNTSFYFLDGNKVTFIEDATIYTLSGNKVATVKANDSLSLAGGFYLINASGKSAKLIIK